MRGPTHALRALGPAFAALTLVGGVLLLHGGSSHAAAPGAIVFASDRDKLNPGEIYSLAPGSAPRDVSRSLAADYQLAVAPVGDLIAFWSGRSGTDRVYLARGDGSRLRLVRASGGNLVAESANGGPLTFSADGSEILAVSYSQTVNIVPHLWRIDARTATARPLRPPCRGIYQPSPDGRLFACGLGRTTMVRDTAGSLRFKLPGSSPIWSSRGWLATSSADVSTVVADASGRTVGQLKGRGFGWSPDGRQLLLARGQSLWVGSTANLARPRMLLATWAGSASFTPDGRYVSTADVKGKPLLVPLAGGTPIAGLDGGLGVWSRSGRVAYVDFAATPHNRNLAVLVSDTRGRNPRVVGRFPFDDHNYANLYWQPDGRRVLFLTGDTCGGKGLFAVSPDGGATRQLTRDPRDLESPVWARDGTRIAFSVLEFSCHRGAGGPIHIGSVAADGTDARRVTDDGDAQAGSFDGSPSFSPDGTQIVFTHGTLNDVSLQIVAASGGERTTLAPPGAVWSGAPVWSPDGSRIAFLSGSSIQAIAPGGGTPEVLAEGLPDVGCGAGGLAWSPDGTQLAVGRAGGIYLITVGQPASARLAIAVRCAADPSFSPDGKQIAFDAPPLHPIGDQISIMVANADGTGVRTLSTVPFRQSVHPTWQPAP